MKKKLKIIGSILLFVAVILGISIYLITQNTFRLPKSLKEKAFNLSRDYYGIDVGLDDVLINLPNNEVVISSFSLSVADKDPFISIDKTEVNLATSTNILDMLNQRAVVDKLVLNNLSFDMLAPQLGEASGAFQLPTVPAKEVLLNGFIINTPLAKFDLSNNTACFKKQDNLGNLSLQIPNGPFGIAGTLMSNLDFDSGSASVNLNINHKNLADCLPIGLFTSEHNVFINDGLFNLSLFYNGNIVERINNPGESIDKLLNNDLYGEIRLDNAKLRWKGFTYEGLILASRTATSTWIIELDGKLAGGKLKAKGNWLGREGKMTDFVAQIEAKNMRPSKTLLSGVGVPDLDYKPGAISFNAVIDGNIEEITASGTLITNDWYFQNKKLEAEVNWDLSKDFVLTTNGLLDTHLGNMNASSTIWLAGDKQFQGILEGALDNIELKEIGNMVNAPLGGKCSGPFTVNFNILDPTKASYEFKASMDNGNFYGFKTSHIDATINGSGSDWVLTNPTATLPGGGKIVVEGYIATSSFDVIAKASDVDFKHLSVDPKHASGTINLDVKASGPLSAPQLEGHIWSNCISAVSIPLNSAKAEVKIKDSILSLDPVVISPVDGSLIDGYFSLNLRDSKIENARINFQQFCIEMLRGIMNESIASQEIDGILSGYMAYNRRNGDNAWNLMFDCRDLLLAGQDVDSIYVEAAAFGKEAEVKGLFIRGFGGTINLTGELINNKKFAGSVEAQGLKFERMEFLKSIIPNLRGSLDFQGALDFDGKRRRGNFTLFSKNIKTGNRELGNYGGEVVINDEKLEIKNGEFDKLGIKVNGDLMWGAKHPYNLLIDCDKVDFSFLPQAHGLSSFEDGSVLVDGECKVEGELASGMPDLIDFKIDEIRVKKDNELILANKPIRLVYQHDALEIRSFELKYKLGILSIEGLVSPKDNTAVSILGKDFSAKALGSLCGVKGFEYDGDVNLNTQLFGKTNDLQYKSDLSITNLLVEGREIPEIKAKFEGNSRVLKVVDTFVKLKNSALKLFGQVDLDNFIPQNLALSLHIPEAPIKDAEVYAPKAIKKAEGQIRGKIDFTGKPNSPKITGDLHLKANRIELTSLRKPITNIEFDLSTADMITTINKLEANIGKGFVKGYGKVDFKNALGALDVHIKGEKLDVPVLTLDVNNASTTIDIGGDIYNPDIKGYLFIPKGKLGLNSDLLPKSSGSKPIFESLKYDFKIVIPKNFWVKNPFINAEMKADLQVVGDLNKLDISGGITTLQGKIFFKQRQFKILNGEIRFSGIDDPFDPYIFVKSEGQVNSTKIFLTLTGNLSNFKPSVYSTPPMSEGDIISLLTLGRDLNAAMNSDSKKLFEEEVVEGLKNSYLSSVIGTKVGEALNLDELYLTSAFDKTSGKTRSFVRIGKSLTEQIFMAYEGRMTDNEKEKYIFEYRLPKGWVISFSFELPKKDQTLSVKYDWTF